MPHISPQVRCSEISYTTRVLGWFRDAASLKMLTVDDMKAMFS
jgi:hypothetical protein